MQGINFIAIGFLKRLQANVPPFAKPVSVLCVMVRLQNPVLGLSVRKETDTVIGTCKSMEYVQATL